MGCATVSSQLLRVIIVVCFWSILLSGCGGGGGGGEQSAADPQSEDRSAPGVQATAATLSWLPPTTRMDGSPLMDLAGYKVYYGVESGNYTQIIDIPTAGISEYVVEGLAPGTYFFVITAYDSAGNQSPPSNEASKTIT